MAGPIPFRVYLANCFWLLLPVLAIDAVWADRLPPLLQMGEFWRDIPPWIAWPENGLRFLVVLLPLFMPLAIDSGSRRMGLAIYLAGLAAYAGAWAMLVLFPASAWSTSLAGLMAPALTPLIWLAGVALVGDGFFIRRVPFQRWLYPCLSLAFVFFHGAHTALVLARAG